MAQGTLKCRNQSLCLCISVCLVKPLLPLLYWREIAGSMYSRTTHTRNLSISLLSPFLSALPLFSRTLSLYSLLASQSLTRAGPYTRSSWLYDNQHLHLERMQCASKHERSPALHFGKYLF